MQPTEFIIVMGNDVPSCYNQLKIILDQHFASLPFKIIGQTVTPVVRAHPHIAGTHFLEVSLVATLEFQGKAEDYERPAFLQNTAKPLLPLSGGIHPQA